MYTPQGVDNFDFAATTGYFIGVDASSFGVLVLRSIANPATSPTISSNVFISVPTTAFPLLVPHLGNNLGAQGKLDAIDDRLMNAHIRKNKLWTVHNVGVNNNGTSSSTTRNGCRWYQINLTSTPTLIQSGTLFTQSDSNDLNQRFYWMPSIMTSGQGHMVIGCSTAGSQEHINAAIAGKLAGQALRTLTLFTSSSTAYNPPFDTGGSRGRRWGDYSNVSLDPKDNMTMWTIQEFCNGTNRFAVQIAKIAAPPPATPISVTPSTISHNKTSVALTITGKRINGSGFYDPGINFPIRLNVKIGNGVTVKSIQYISPIKISITVSTVNVKVGVKPIITIINPDGQRISAAGLLTVN